MKSEVERCPGSQIGENHENEPAFFAVAEARSVKGIPLTSVEVEAESGYELYNPTLDLLGPSFTCLLLRRTSNVGWLRRVE
ncbi:MAG: hypothetical protein CMN04_00295 [Roseibacillus sp.]|nr:hypothetical protein [Roseibacillus sp.]